MIREANTYFYLRKYPLPTKKIVCRLEMGDEQVTSTAGLKIAIQIGIRSFDVVRLCS